MRPVVIFSLFNCRRPDSLRTRAGDFNDGVKAGTVKIRYKIHEFVKIVKKNLF